MDRKTQTSGSGAADTRLGASDGVRRVRDVVETEIIPRLVHAHAQPRSNALERQLIRPAEVEAFTRALLERAPDHAQKLLDFHCERGIPLEGIYLQLFVGAAHLLGAWWESDESNFSQVTLAMTRIHAMLNELSPSFHATAMRSPLERGSERRILMTTLPGQHHTLG